jgi:restriction endonuclease S subunit
MITKVTNNKLPTGWKWVKLEEVLISLETGSRPIGGAVGITEGIPSISAEQMGDFGAFYFSDIKYVPKDYYEKMERGHIRENDILIVKDGATTGKTCFVDSTFPFEEAVINEHVFICRCDETKVIPKLLFLWLWGTDGQIAIKTNYQGAAIGGINQSFTKKISIPLPPLSEQKRIVKILEEKLSSIEKVKKAAEKKLQAANILKQAYLNSAFKNNDSKTWGKTKLGEICDFVGGMQPPKYMFSTVKISDYIRLLQIQDYKSDTFAVYIPENEAKRTCIESDVMIGRYGPPLFQILRGLSGAYNVALMKAVPNEQVISKGFLYYLLQDSDIQKKVIEKSQRSAGQSGIQSTTLKNMIVSIPSLGIQNKTSRFLDIVLLQTINLINKIQAELELINKLPQSYLKQAFEGKL